MSNKNRHQPTQTPAPAPTDAPEVLKQDQAAAEVAGDKASAEQNADADQGIEQTSQSASDAAAPKGDATEEGKSEEPVLLGETNLGLSPFASAPAPASQVEGNPVAEAAQAATAAPELPHLAQTFEEKMVAKHASGARSTQALITYLNMYVEAMHPKKPENQAVFAQQQASLWNALYTTLETEEAFDANFTILLEYFAEHGHKNGVFHAYNNFRGMENVPLNKDQRTAFEYLCYLLHTAANSKQWNQMQINVPKSISEQIFSEGARNRVMNFLRIG